jgi:hypothetical protein
MTEELTLEQMQASYSLAKTTEQQRLKTMQSQTTSQANTSIFANKKDLIAAQKRVTELQRENAQLTVALASARAASPHHAKAPAKASTVKRGGGTLYAQYAALKKSDRIAASKFWEVNKAAIATEIKK